MNFNKLSQLEKQALYKNKLQNGKSEEEANEEIKRDVKFEKVLNFNLKENIKLKKEVELLEKKLEMWKRKYMALELRQKIVTKKDKIEKGNASVSLCNKVLTFLKLNKEMDKSKIRVGCGLSNTNIDIVLNFLERNNLIIKEERKNRKNYPYYAYSLKGMKGGSNEGNSHLN
ncbi:MAG TPA: hypothetical protein VGB37_16535 [Candidatus Lokiarchaeia archaeon]